MTQESSQSSVADVLTKDGRVWATWSIQNVMAQGYGWSVEVVGPNGYNEQAIGGTISYWAAKRQIRRHIKRMRKAAFDAA